MSREHNAEQSTDKPKLNLEEAVRNALEGLRYGSVEITVHNARVVQIGGRLANRRQELAAGGLGLLCHVLPPRLASQPSADPTGQHPPKSYSSKTTSNTA